MPLPNSKEPNITSAKELITSTTTPKSTTSSNFVTEPTATPSESSLTEKLSTTTQKTTTTIVTEFHSTEMPKGQKKESIIAVVEENPGMVKWKNVFAQSQSYFPFNLNFEQF